MDFDKNIFRAYDIRGVYPSELNDEVAYRTARAIAEIYPHIKKMVVSRDPRHSSPSLSKNVIKGFLESGVDVIDLGLASDPLHYFMMKHYKLDGGIAISGSHNPSEYNGLTLDVSKEKGLEPKGIIKEELERIKNRVSDGKDFGMKEKGKVEKKDIEQEYIDYVSGKIKLKRPLKVIIDTGNGACGLLPEKIFKKLGCEVKTLFAEPNGDFPNHLPDPYKEENIKQIEETVLKEKADIGFAFDTDGDRVAPIDNKGRVVSGDFCLLMLARQALEKKKGPIVHCMRVSQALLDEAKKRGINTYFSVSHHSAVHDLIIKNKAIFGGEITLHFFFPQEYYLNDEALFSALKIAEVAAEHKDFAEHIDSLPRYHASPEIFIPAADDIKEGLIKDLQKYLKENNYKFIDVDGARIVFDNGWALARFANTTPLIKCRFEGRTKQDLVKIEKEVIGILDKVGIHLTEKNYKELGLEK